MIETTPKPTIEYVNNAKFYEALKEFAKLCEEQPEVNHRVPEYIGECFLKIATNLSRRYNFVAYSFRDEMIGDAIEVCLKRVRSFKPEKSTSAFGYFTTTCYRAMVERIKLEKKQAKVKREIVKYAGVDTMSLQGHDEDGEFTTQLNDFLMSLGPDEVIPTKPVDHKPDPLESFYE